MAYSVWSVARSRRSGQLGEIRARPKFPSFKFVLLEGGVSWVPPILWRMDKNWKALRMTTPWVDRLPSEIVTDHLRFSTQPIEEPENPKHFQAMLTCLMPNRMLMFSTDYPHWDGDTPDFAARTFPKALRPAIMVVTRFRHGLAEAVYAPSRSWEALTEALLHQAVEVLWRV